MTDFLFRLARASAWGRAFGLLLGGNPLPVLRRVRNRAILRLLGPFFRL